MKSNPGLKEWPVHPRLYIGHTELQRLGQPAHLPLLKECEEVVERSAERFAASVDFEWEQNAHNAHLIRARHQQTRVMTLLIQWRRTGESRWRDVAIEHLRRMATWDVWSWITWRDNNSEPEAIFDLSYGENAATLGLAWDLLCYSLDDSEKELIMGMAKRWVVPSFLKHTTPGSEMWWCKPEASNCNWKAVCAGGAGLLALSMAGELAEADEMIRRAEEQVRAFMDTLEHTEGGWAEGVAYWNYGMRYAFMFLLSWERTFQKKHDVLDRDSTRKTLWFPADFAPFGLSCGFGDIGDGKWQPEAVHYAVAERTGCDGLFPVLNSAMKPGERASWPTAAEMLALHPRRHGASKKFSGQAIKLYKGIGWARMTDKWPNPRLYISVRGGNSRGPHNSADLLSWHAMVNGRRMVWSSTNHEYIDTTFSNRRFELPELRADTKNTILVGGVGMVQPGDTVTDLLKIGAFECLRLDASSAYQIGGGGNNLVKFVGRLFVWLDGEGLILVDTVRLGHTNRMESLIHTHADVSLAESSAELRTDNECLRLVFAASAPFVLAESLTRPTNPLEKPARVIRWASRGLEAKAALAVLALPHEGSATLRLETSSERIVVKAELGERHVEFCTSWTLEQP